jgi:tetratricopeptide (TPR) repeat protein
MHRWLLTALLTVGLAGLALARQDSVNYFDRVAKKKDSVKITGKIEEESPAGIKIRVKEGKKEIVKEIPTADIEQIEYRVPEVTTLNFRAPFNKEALWRRSADKNRSKFLQEALDGYTKLEDEVRNHANARRYIQYKRAEVTALLAQTDPTKVQPAIKLLSDFKTLHPTGWQIVPALKTLARLLEDTGKIDEARKAYEELADVPGVPRPVKLDSEILVGRLLIRGGKFADAQQRLEKLLGSLSADDEQKPIVGTYLLESKMGQDKMDGLDRELAAVIKASSDGRVRGTAYNLLGDWYRKKSQPKEAFWAYLRVDTLYNDDPETHARALYHLAELFDKEKGNPIRARECLRQLRDKRFAGTTYQKMLPPEEKDKEESAVPKKEPVKKKK